MRLLILSIMLMGLLTQAAHSNTKPQTIFLTKKNTLVFRGVVSDSSVAALEVELMDMVMKLKATETIFLVMDTPGGSVDAGMQLIDFIHGLPNKVKTLTLFAASMGFQIVQNLDERLILPSGTLMSHRASVSGVSGQLPGDLITRLSFYLRFLVNMDQLAADRMGMSLADYSAAIHDELWLKGEESIRFKAADRVVYALCDNTFNGTSETELGTFFGATIMGTMSNCPLISGVLKYRIVMPNEKTKQGKKMCTAYMNDKISFIRDYIVRGKLLFPSK